MNCAKCWNQTQFKEIAEADPEIDTRQLAINDRLTGKLLMTEAEITTTKQEHKVREGIPTHTHNNSLVIVKNLDKYNIATT